MTEQNQIPGAPPVSTVRDKRGLPEGVVPKQAQAYVIAGLALLILMAVMFSKNHARPALKEPLPPPMSVANDMNQRKIRELEQNLSADQKQSQQTQKLAAGPTRGDANPASTTPPPMSTPMTTVPTVASTDPVHDQTRDPVKDAERELAFKSRFASNLVAKDSAELMERPDMSDIASSHLIPKSQSVDTAPTAAAPGKHAPEVNVNAAHGQPYVVFEGSTVDTVLTNRLDGEFSGPVKVMVTNPVYSQDRQHLLIPEGSFILGDVQKVGGLGQKRLAVTFHRLLMPDGYSVDLDQFHGLDQVGETGLKDKLDNHYLRVFGTSIALGLIAGAAEATTSNSALTESGTDAYKSGIASSLSQSSANVLDRFINILPTITIREGHRIKVYITQDMLLPTYENHTIAGDI